ncbi:MAG: UDP-N-acetylmuramoyl-L-alanyl-D-glutamate--2,6-diaminopimelate ligase [Magnetococcales bacterium]|nr:UDP-N-acetylmuramoyl-L-alanyl-D-glutamate--2,6-diaminopimelate ligase [Magnetococcales bacterium]
MRLSQLQQATRGQELNRTGADVKITGLCADSRAVTPGALFAALPGSRADGGGFIDAAIAAGAVAILHDGSRTLPVPSLIHPEPRAALSHLAAAFHGHPADHLTMLAVTGSNGKTSVAGMVEAILHAAEIPTGVIGTTGIRHPGGTQGPSLTTPDPIRFQATLAAMRAAGCQAVVAEVSSHALDQARTAGIPWQAAAFTNLSRDHLDYHGTMEAYWLAKRRLFLDPPRPNAAIINLDDPQGLELAKVCREAGLPVSGFSLEEHPEAEIRAEALRLDWLTTGFDLITPMQSRSITLKTSGRFQVANALTAAALCRRIGIDFSTIVAGLSLFQPIKGRMETIRQGQPFTILVDFAHTPDALERLLSTVVEISPRARHILVFGCGGERDVGKRPLMGEIAARLASFTVLTDDNPRSEDPATIRAAIRAGMAGAEEHLIEIPDRAEAIGHAIGMARAGDVVLIAGKGHETQQILDDGPIPFDDGQVARAQLAEIGFQGLSNP